MSNQRSGSIPLNKIPRSYLTGWTDSIGITEIAGYLPVTFERGSSKYAKPQRRLDLGTALACHTSIDDR